MHCEVVVVIEAWTAQYVMLQGRACGPVKRGERGGGHGGARAHRIEKAAADNATGLALQLTIQIAEKDGVGIEQLVHVGEDGCTLGLPVSHMTEAYSDTNTMMRYYGRVA